MKRKYCIRVPKLLFHLLVFRYCRNPFFTEDLHRAKEVFREYLDLQNLSDWKCFVIIMLEKKEFRNIFYFRHPRFYKLLNKLYPELSGFHMGVVDNKVGPGLFIQHGDSTYLVAQSVGCNLWIGQNVTVGFTNKGCPTLGDNVMIGTGAIVVGPIRIGNNVKIGAGAIVVDDVPDNCTVVSPKSRIIKKDNQKLV